MLGLFLSMGVMLFGTFVHMTDGDSPSGNFDSIPSGMWFALVTLTTVGYGEAVRVTRVFASFQNSRVCFLSKVRVFVLLCVVWLCLDSRPICRPSELILLSLSACCPACECRYRNRPRGNWWRPRQYVLAC